MSDQLRGLLTILRRGHTDLSSFNKAVIQLQEATANIELLNEIQAGGFVVDEELDRLKELEKDCEAVVELYTVPDWTVAGLDLPHISDDSTPVENLFFISLVLSILNFEIILSFKDFLPLYLKYGYADLLISFIQFLGFYYVIV